MSGMLTSTAAAVGIIDKAVVIAKKLADDGGELDKAMTCSPFSYVPITAHKVGVLP
ncbi:MAG: hypothetical protein ACRDD5_08785 [Silvania sp.]|uniref:hypothetical protein n=1 Tax=Silvania sp. TaxID=3016633 RepID=UPI003EE47F13